MSKLKHKGVLTVLVIFTLVLTLLNTIAVSAKTRRKSTSRRNTPKSRQVSKPSAAAKNQRTSIPRSATAKSNRISPQRSTLSRNTATKKRPSSSITRKPSIISQMNRSIAGIKQHPSNSASGGNTKLYNKAKQVPTNTTIRTRLFNSSFFGRKPENKKSPLLNTKNQSSINTRTFVSTDKTRHIRNTSNTKRIFTPIEAKQSNTSTVSRIRVGKSTTTDPDTKKENLQTTTTKVQPSLRQRKLLNPEITKRIGRQITRQDTNPNNSSNTDKGELANSLRNNRMKSSFRTEKKAQSALKHRDENTIGNRNSSVFSIVKKPRERLHKTIKPNETDNIREQIVNKQIPLSRGIKQPYRRELKGLTAKKLGDIEDNIPKKSIAADLEKKAQHKIGTREKRKSRDLTATKVTLPRTRLRKTNPKRDTIITKDTARDAPLMQKQTRAHRWTRSRLKKTDIIYHDRPHLVRHNNRHVHRYKDYRDRICHRIIWPRFRFLISYRWGPHFTFSYVYPYYHRKYIFVSLGGYWPIEYSYIRYYWYGCHPYTWCGYYPIAREVQGDTYNYYTYNYYNSDADDIKPVDHTTFADVREKLAKQAEEPAETTLADTLFEEAVKAFESDDYNTATVKFAKAMELAPEDMVLPFAYAQALFANEQYYQASDAVRTALAKICSEKEGVFYPRGLYADDDLLLEQIERLVEKVELDSSEADLQLLLGYHLLGIGETDAALEPLVLATQDPENADAAKILLDLLEKIRDENATEQSTESATEETKQINP